MSAGVPVRISVHDSEPRGEGGHRLIGSFEALAGELMHVFERKTFALTTSDEERGRDGFVHVLSTERCDM